LSGFVEDKDRKIVPRWRDLKATICRGELGCTTLAQAAAVLDSDFSRKLDDWNRHGTIPFALELIGAAAVPGRETEATDAAKLVLSRGTSVSPAARDLAEVILGQGDPQRPETAQSSNSAARELRARLRADPRNSLASLGGPSPPLRERWLTGPRPQGNEYRSGANAYKPFRAEVRLAFIYP
jgi:hypothetical protein